MLWRIKARGKVNSLISKSREKPLLGILSKDRFVQGELMEEMLMEGHFQWEIMGNVSSICCATDPKTQLCINNTERWSLGITKGKLNVITTILTQDSFYSAQKGTENTRFSPPWIRSLAWEVQSPISYFRHRNVCLIFCVQRRRSRKNSRKRWGGEDLL